MTQITATINKELTNVKKQKEISKSPLFKCGKCTNDIEEESNTIECHDCRQWFHKACTDLDSKEFNVLTQGNQCILWVCPICLDNRGKRDQKIESLEGRIDQLLGVIQKLEDTIILKLEARVEVKVNKILEETVKEVEQKLNSKIDGKLESVVVDREEEQEKDKRKLNVVISNLPESTKDNREDRLADDLERAKNMIGLSVPLDATEISNPIRLGVFKLGSQPRRLKVTISTLAKKQAVVRDAWKINRKDTNQKDRIYVN